MTETQTLSHPNMLTQTMERIISTINAPVEFLKQSLSGPSESKSDNSELEKKTSSFRDIMELPVNNFLKTCKEIECEFYYVLNTFKSAFSEMPDSFDSYDRIMKKTETSRPLHPLDIALALSGSMEENY